MKKIIVFLVFVIVAIYSAHYLVQSGRLFASGLENISGKQNIAAVLAFGELVTQYPNSPFISLAKMAAVLKDPQFVTLLDLYYSARTEKNSLELLFGRSPAFYDPFVFAGLIYYLLITFIGIAQKYWAKTNGLSIQVLFRRDTFAFVLGLVYVLWIRGTAMPDSAISRLVSGIQPSLLTPAGLSAISLCFTALILFASVWATIRALFGFLGNSK